MSRIEQRILIDELTERVFHDGRPTTATGNQSIGGGVYTRRPINH